MANQFLSRLAAAQTTYNVRADLVQRSQVSLVVTGTGSAIVVAFGVVAIFFLLIYFIPAAARTGGMYGSGAPGGIDGYFFRLCSKSTMTLMAGPAIHELWSPV